MNTHPKTIARSQRRQKIRHKIQGTAKIPRLVVFRSLKNNYAQLVDDMKRLTIVSSSDLKIKKGTPLEKAKQIGLALAKAAQEKKITQAVFDRAGYQYHGRVKAIAEGAREGGLKF